MSLKDFVLTAWPKTNTFCDKYRHVIPQSDYLFNENGEQLVDFIGRFEHLQKDFSQVCQHLNISDSTLPHKNSSYSFRRLWTRKLRHLFSLNKRVKKHYSEYYDEELKQLVADIYAQDIALFGYEFEYTKNKSTYSALKLAQAR